MSKYNVVFEYDGRVATKRRFVSYESREAFDRACIPRIPAKLGKVIAEGVLIQEAFELCKEVEPKGPVFFETPSGDQRLYRGHRQYKGLEERI